MIAIVSIQVFSSKETFKRKCKIYNTKQKEEVMSSNPCQFV